MANSVLRIILDSITGGSSNRPADEPKPLGGTPSDSGVPLETVRPRASLRESFASLRQRLSGAAAASGSTLRGLRGRIQNAGRRTLRRRPQRPGGESESSRLRDAINTLIATLQSRVSPFLAGSINRAVNATLQSRVSPYLTDAAKRVRSAKGRADNLMGGIYTRGRKFYRNALRRPAFLDRRPKSFAATLPPSSEPSRDDRSSWLRATLDSWGRQWQEVLRVTRSGRQAVQSAPARIKQATDRMLGRMYTRGRRFARNVRRAPVSTITRKVKGAFQSVASAVSKRVASARDWLGRMDRAGARRIQAAIPGATRWAYRFGQSVRAPFRGAASLIRSAVGQARGAGRSAAGAAFRSAGRFGAAAAGFAMRGQGGVATAALSRAVGSAARGIAALGAASGTAATLVTGAFAGVGLAVAGAIVALKAFDSYATSAAQKLANYNGPIAAAVAQGDIMREFSQIRRGAALQNDITRYVSARNDLEERAWRAIIEIEKLLFGKLGPLAEGAFGVLGQLLDRIASMAGVLDKLSNLDALKDLARDIAVQVVKDIIGGENMEKKIQNLIAIVTVWVSKAVVNQAQDDINKAILPDNDPAFDAFIGLNEPADNWAVGKLRERP